MKTMALVIAGMASFAAVPSFADGTCRVKSGPATAALVELYTSEGCSSCPPAEKEFSQVRSIAGQNAVIIPLALHVTYWDHIGWKDRFAQTAFDERQRLSAAFEKSRLVYTPEFFINGKEVRRWSNELPEAIRKVNKTPAQAEITLAWTKTSDRTLRLEATASARDPRAKHALHLAVTESKLASKVLRGENGGVTLQHEDTVRAWFKPAALAGGSVQYTQELSIPGDWNWQEMRAVAFVQNMESGAVIQAVAMDGCSQEKR